MRKQAVKLHIKTMHTLTDISPVVENDIFIEGELIKKEGGFTLSYLEPAEHGLDGVKTTIKYDGEMARIEHEGEKNGLIVQRNQRHLCHYLTPAGSMMIGVSGGDIKVDMKNGGLDMEMDYSIDFNASSATRNNIKITARPL